MEKEYKWHLDLTPLEAITRLQGRPDDKYGPIVWTSGDRFRLTERNNAGGGGFTWEAYTVRGLVRPAEGGGTLLTARIGMGIWAWVCTIFWSLVALKAFILSLLSMDIGHMLAGSALALIILGLLRFYRRRHYNLEKPDLASHLEHIDDTFSSVTLNRWPVKIPRDPPSPSDRRPG